MMRRRCAVKLLPPRLQSDRTLVEQFHLEARTLAALDHPNVVRAYDFNVDIRGSKRVHYLVMEYVEGQDLRQLVQTQGALPFPEAADFIRQAAEGLAYAHEAGFVHRDVKPANLLVGPDGTLKILDLGMARFALALDPADADGEQSTIMGTADYVAPEQIADSRHVDGRADLYSLGYSLYFLLTGHRPFPRATVPEVLKAHRDEQPAPIAMTRPDAPPGLVAIFDKMTAKRPADRYATARQAAAALRAWLDRPKSAESPQMATPSATGRGVASRTETRANLSALTDTSCLELVPDDSGPQRAGQAKRKSRSGSADAESPRIDRETPPTDWPVKPRREPSPSDWITAILTAPSLDVFPTVKAPLLRGSSQPPPRFVASCDRILRIVKKSPRRWALLAGLALAGLVAAIGIGLAIR
jgi:serine/threonine protein kinase